MGRKDKKTVPVPVPVSPPVIPPPSPSSSESDTAPVSNTNNSSSAASDTDTASSSDSPPPKINVIPNSTKPDTSPEQDDAVSSSEDDEEDSPEREAEPEPSPKPAITPSKRPAENNVKNLQSENKKPKKEKTVISALPITNQVNASGSVNVTAVTTPHKQLFQRVWSDEDEIVILKGMIDFKANNHLDPMSNVDDFLHFIKKSLKVADANRAQIVSKVRRLKTKFRNAKKKKALTNPHELEVFRLSKQIWGDDPEFEDDNKVKVEKEKGKDKDKDKEWVIRRCRDVGGEEIDLVGDVEFGFLGENGAILKEAMSLVEGEERKELIRKVKMSNVAYLEAFLTRLKVMEFAAKKVLDDYKNDKI